MYKTIIVPVDLSHAERGKGMIDAAKKLIDKGGGIFLINVVEDMPTYVAAELPGGFIDKSKKEAHETLKKMAKEAGLDTEVEVRSGSAHTAILGFAQEKGTDLIIIASHHPELADYLLGSTASRVVRHAKCSVLIIR